MPLHADTIKFLEGRNKFRNELAAALTGKPQENADGSEQEPEPVVDPATADVISDSDGTDYEPIPPATEENPDPAAGSGCVLPARGESDGEKKCTNVVVRLAEVTPITMLRDPKGWPNSDKLYEDHRLALDRMATGSQLSDDDMTKILIYQRQVNVMESYRKMLLHKKQQACHFLSSWCECMKSEPQSQAQLNALLLNDPVGIVATKAATNTV
jgi:hypothetical protein